MKPQSVVSFGVLLIAVGLFWPAYAAGQNTDPQPQAGGVAKTPDGHPDMQGLWLFFNSSPLETPGTPTRRRAGETRDSAGAQDALQDAQIERRERVRGEAQVNPFYSEGPIRSRQVRPQPSLVVEPADGKVPVLASAVEKNNYRLDHFYDSYVYLNPAERCITYGVPGSQFPSINASVRIVQAPGYVGFVNEMNGARIIPVNASSHLPQGVRLWNGDSRGRWEGDTLVIEVTNYNDRGTVTHSPDRLQGITHSEALRVVERYTPVDANTINYEVTIEDPKTYSAPWKAAFPLMRDDGSYKVFEYVCHEGNERFMNIVLGGGRLMDKGAAAEAAIASPSRKAAGEAGQALGK